MRYVVYDIETLKNLFTLCAVDITTKESYKFVIHKSRNDYKQMVEFVKSCDGMIGFNSIDFDYAVLHPFLIEGDYCLLDGKDLAAQIYKRSQKVISWQDDGKNKEWITPIVPQRDLFRIWHFNNKVRSTSLKYLQINMNSENCQEMPIHHTDTVEEARISEVLDYNLNDVLTTLEFYHLSKNKIKLRKTLTEKYEGDFSNYSDNKIAERIFVIELAKLTGRSEKDIMQGRTFRKNIAASDCIIPGINFQSPEFQKIYNEFQKLVIVSTKKDKANELFTITFDGVVYEFGFGGLHAFRQPGVYRNLTSADVSSYYPNLSIGCGFYPEHLGNAFCKVYKHIYNERKKFGKGTDENAAYKLALNGTFGMSNAEWSCFFDRRFTMSITINGQLLLALLCERITLYGAGSIIMANTDGIEVDVIDDTKFRLICHNWESEFKLELEFSKYKVLAVRDVNNYTGLSEDGKIKEKGDFLVEREIYKDQSMKIVPFAVRQYFHKNIPIEETINNCDDLKMFIMGKRAKTGNLRYRGFRDGIYFDEKLPKNVRYYISNSGGSIVKSITTVKKIKDKTISPNQISLFEVNQEATQTVEKIINLHVGEKMTVFPRWIKKPFEDYGVNKKFYIQEANKLLNSIMTKQTELV